MVIRNREVNDSLLAEGRTVRQLLHLAADVQEFSLAFATVQQNDSELAVVTRSMLEILNEAASGVEVPPVEVSEGRATPALDSAARADAGRFRVRVHASESEPASENAFVAVHYRKHWFWIDDRDIAAKRSMGFLLTLFTLAESGTTMSPPVLTITKP